MSEAQGGALDRVSRSAQHLLELINDILDISKIEAGKLEVFPEDTDLGMLVRDTATSVQLQAAEKGLELKIEVPEELRARTDPARVRQIVLNLLSNAVKFTDAGHVRVALRRDGERFEIAVEDTGPGIDLEDQERVFEEFEQSHRTSGVAGTGLGLAISRRLAALLGGELGLRSTPGTGSTFILRLPAQVPVETAAPTTT
jgi:signal transduction histidine kinase